MGYTFEIQIRIVAPTSCAQKFRRRFTFRGFTNFSVDEDDCKEYIEAYYRYSAHFAVREGEARKALARLVLKMPMLRRHEAGVAVGDSAELITDFAAPKIGELIYTFSIWKDNCIEVLQQVARVFGEVLEEDYGPDWREHWPEAWPLGFEMITDQRWHGSRFDLLPVIKEKALRRRKTVGNIVFGDADGYCGPADFISPSELGCMEDFSAELREEDEEEIREELFAKKRAEEAEMLRIRAERERARAAQRARQEQEWSRMNWPCFICQKAPVGDKQPAKCDECHGWFCRGCFPQHRCGGRN